MCPANELKSRAPAPAGHVEFDDRGNAIWHSDDPGHDEEQAAALAEFALDDLGLAIEDSPPRFAAATRSTTSLEEGFDPYSSGHVVRDRKRARRTDLRALSEEIKRKREASTAG